MHRFDQPGPNPRPFGTNLAPTWIANWPKLGPWEQHGFNMRVMAGLIRNLKSSKHPFSQAFPTFFGINDTSHWAIFPCCVSAGPHFELSWRQRAPSGPKFPLVGATRWKLGLCWAQFRRQMPPTQGQVAHVRPGASYAHVGPKSAQLKSRTGKFDASRLLVGPSRPASFLSIIPWVRAILVSKRLEYRRFGGPLQQVLGLRWSWWYKCHPPRFLAAALQPPAAKLRGNMCKKKHNETTLNYKLITSIAI